MYDSAEQALFWQDSRREKADSRGKWMYALFAVVAAGVFLVGITTDRWVEPAVSWIKSMTSLKVDTVTADPVQGVPAAKAASADSAVSAAKAASAVKETLAAKAASAAEQASARGELSAVGAGADVAMRIGKEQPWQTVVSGIPIIVVDAGHGGEDEGCLREGVNEKDINLAIAKMVQEKLTAMGYQVIMTREDDRYMTVEERVELANESGADLYISIHQNAFEDEKVQGIEVWYNREKGGEENKRLALLLGQQTIRRTGAVERELKEDSQMYGVVNTTMPACLIETGFLSNKEERMKLVTAEYQEQLAQGIAQAIEYYYHPKTMYLTFDDGPFKENTSRVLDILAQRGIKATFFVVGEYVERNPEVAKRIVEEGHAIGVHCYSHDYETLYASVDSYMEDFEKAHQIVLEVTGVDAKMFRFPGGSVNGYNEEVREGIIQEMTERGYVYYDWNASLEDAVHDPKPQQLIANAVESTFGREKVIMLAHDVVYTTGICLEDLLDHFPEYRMEVLTEEVKPVQF